MSNYCTNCKHLAKESIANKTQWHCIRNVQWTCLPTTLNILCGNPRRTIICEEQNWYESENKSEVHKLVTEHGRAMQFVTNEILKQQKKEMSDYCTNCKWLGKETNAGRTNWFCRRKSRIGYMLQSLCGNPTKLLQCINENWHEVKVKQQEKKMTTEEMIKVMQAYVDGKDLQYRNKKTGMDWQDVTNPAWEWYDYDYRIKPEPKYRPLKPEELIELKGKWLKYEKDEDYELVTRVDVVSNRVYTSGTGRDAEELLRCWTYEDGTPIGKLEE